MMQVSPSAVILSDYQMPQMNGVQLFQTIASHWPNTVRLMLTDNGDKEDIVAAKTDHMVHRVIDKPWSSEHLIAMIELAFACVDDTDYQLPENKDTGIKYIHSSNHSGYKTKALIGRY